MSAKKGESYGTEKGEITQEETGKPQVFTKRQLLSASRYQDKWDLLQVILEDGETYSVHDVEKAVERYLKGKVR